MSAPITEAEVLAALAQVPVPELNGDVVSRNLARNVKICDGSVAFDLLLPSPSAQLRKELEAACRAAVGSVPGVTLVNVRAGLEVPGRPGAAGWVATVSIMSFRFT